jgi:hypothetical protein
MLVTLHTKLLALARRLCIRNPQPLVYELFSITKLDDLFDLHPRVLRVRLPVTSYPAPARAGLLATCSGVKGYAVLLSRLRREGYKAVLWRDGRLAVEYHREFRPFEVESWTDGCALSPEVE